MHKLIQDKYNVKAKEFNIDIEASWIIGDSENDIKAGKNFGCKTIAINKDLNAEINLFTFAVE